MPKKIPEFLEEFPGKNRGLVYVDGDDYIFYGKHKYVFLSFFITVGSVRLNLKF